MLKEKASEVCLILEKKGFEAYFVGGCVRDYLMEKRPHDFDITTNAKSEEIISCLSKNGYPSYLKGGSCGTVGIFGIEEIEITPYRTEGEYLDHRHPNAVHFVKELKEDLSRRDFTVNAMAMSADGKKVVDLFCGKEDINKKILRCVGDPRVRFEEDALRIMRALRFAAVLGFSVEENTKKAIFEKKHLLSCISGERKNIELHKLLLSEKPHDIIAEFSDILCDITGSVSPDGINGVECDFSKRFFYMTRNESADVLLRKISELKLSNSDSDAVIKYKTIFDIFGECPKKDDERIVSAVCRYGYFFREYLEIFGKEGEFSHVFGNSSVPKCIKELKISGNDLTALGISGKDVGMLLGKLLSDALSGKVKNQKEALIAYLKNII